MPDEMTTYTVPYDPDYWGCGYSEEESLEAAYWLIDLLRERFPAVEFRLVPERQSWSNQASGDEGLIEAIRIVEERFLSHD